MALCGWGTWADSGFVAGSQGERGAGADGDDKLAAYFCSSKMLCSAANSNGMQMDSGRGLIPCSNHTVMIRLLSAQASTI